MDKKLKEKLIIFRKVNTKKISFNEQHQNVMNSKDLKDVTKNQGICKANLRKYIKEKGVDENFWKNV